MKKIIETIKILLINIVGFINNKNTRKTPDKSHILNPKKKKMDEKLVEIKVSTIIKLLILIILLSIIFTIVVYTFFPNSGVDSGLYYNQLQNII